MENGLGRPGRWFGLPDSMFRGPLEELGLRALFRSLYSIGIVLSSLIEVLLLSPDELEEMRRALRGECLRQRSEYDFLSRYL